MATYSAGSASVEISPSLRNFANELRTRLRGIEAKFDVDVGADLTRFRNELDTVLAQQHTVNIDVNLNSGDVAARLDYLSRDRDINLDLQLNPAQLAQIQAQIAALGLGNIAIQVGSASSSFSSLGSVAGVALAAVAAVGAVSMIPLIASASQALGVIALFPAVAGGAVGALGALGIGMSGITGAFSAMSDGATGAGGATEDMGHKATQAAQQVEDAKISLRNAEENLADAQNDARRAQNDLNESYSEGVRQLQDMNDQLDSAKLSTEGAQLALVKALERQREVNTDSKSTGTDRWSADLDVREARERLEQQRRQTNELAQDTAKANREGVAGTDAVTSATERYNNASKAQETAAQQVRQAQNALTEALYQQQQSSISAAGGVDKFAEAMAKLSPNAQDFVLKMRELGSAWTDLRKSVQDRLFDGLGDSITDLATNYFPLLKTGLGDIASAFNGGLKQIFSEMTSPRVKSQWTDILNNTSLAVGNLMGALSNLGRAFTTIAQVGSTFLPGMTQSFEDSTAKFADWIDELADNGKLKEFIQGAIDKFQELWNIGGQVVELIKNIFAGSKEEGDGMLEGISKTLDRWNEFLGSEEGQQKLKDFFGDVRDTLQEILSIITETAKIIGDVKGVTDSLGLTNKPENPEGTTDTNKSPVNSKRLKDKDGNTVDSKGNPAYNPGEGPLTSWIPVVPKDGPVGAIVEFNQKLNEAGGLQGILAQKTQSAWGSISSTISERWSATIAPALGNFGSGAVNLGTTAAREIGGRAVDAWNTFSGGASRVAGAVQGRLSELLGFLSGLPGRIGGLMGQVVSGGFGQLQSGATGARDWVTGRFDELVNMITGMPARITTAASNMFEGIKEAFRGALNWIIKAWNDFKIEMKIPDKIPMIGGRGFTVETPDLAFLASGGSVSGPGGPRDDMVPAMLSNGEFVVNAASTAAHLPLLRAINDGVPHLADGGQIVNGSEITTSVQQTMWDAVRNEFPDATLNSGTRYADVGSGYDYHMQGMALDLGGPMGDIARWIYGLNATQPVTELIHAPLDGWENLKDGAPLNYGAGTDSQHYDHVHWAMTSFSGATPAPPAPVDGNPYVPTPGQDQMPGWETDPSGGASGFTSPGATSSPTTWSGFAGDFGQKAGTILAKGALDFFGINDEIPPIVKGVQEYNQFRDQQNQPMSDPSGTSVPPTAPAPSAPAPAAPPPPPAPAVVYDTPEGGIAAGTPGAKDAVWAVWQGLGWTGDQWLDTLRLVNGESSWDETAANPSSTAEGLFQFLDSTRAQYGYGPTAAEQAGPGASYITDRYGTPSDAWAFWSAQSPHWYANGGPVIGPGGPRDDAIPAFLSNGEYVVNSMAARQNMPILEAINSGQKVAGGRTTNINFNGGIQALDARGAMREADRQMSLATMGTMGALPA